jgi:hypothetical protein
LSAGTGIQYSEGDTWGRILASYLVWVRQEAGDIIRRPEKYPYTMLALPLDASRCMTLEGVPTPICVEELATHIQNTVARMIGLRCVGYVIHRQMFFGCAGQWEQELTPAGQRLFGGTHCSAVGPDKPHMHNGNLCRTVHEFFVSGSPQAAKAAFMMTLEKIRPRCVSIFLFFPWQKCLSYVTKRIGGFVKLDFVVELGSYLLTKLCSGISELPGVRGRHALQKGPSAG